MKNWVLRIVLPILVLAAGFAAFALLVNAKPKPKKVVREVRGTLVEGLRVSGAHEQVTISAQGTVVPARELVLQPEITGRIQWQSSRLVPGGRFKAGEPLVRIDPSDYALAVEQQQAAIATAQAELRIEQSRRQVAEREWEIIGEERQATAEGKAVALREPQLQAVAATLARARAAEGQAQLALGRATIVAPFNGFVISESVEVGQLVAPASPLAKLVGSDEFWVQVSVPMEKLDWLRIPGVNVQTNEGAGAVVEQDLGGRRLRREGQIVRLLGDLDPVGRMARLLVRVHDPFGLDGAGGQHRSGIAARPEGGEAATGQPALPLLLGSFVTVHLESRDLDGVIEIPRVALREGNRVYVTGADSKLEIRDVQILWRREQTVLLRSGLAPGDWVITSRLPGAVSGMPLRKADKAAPAPASQP